MSSAVLHSKMLSDVADRFDKLRSFASESVERLAVASDKFASGGVPGHLHALVDELNANANHGIALKIQSDCINFCIGGWCPFHYHLGEGFDVGPCEDTLE